MDAETEQIFKEREDLLPKLQKLQQNIIKKMYDIVDNEKSQVKVSFFVYETLSALSKSHIKSQWRSLEFLRQKKSQFDATQS